MPGYRYGIVFGVLISLPLLMEITTAAESNIGGRGVVNSGFSAALPAEVRLRVESQLLEMLGAEGNAKGSSQERLVQVQVLVKQPLTAEARADVEALGGTIQLEYGDQIQLLVPLRRIPELVSLPLVQYVHLPHRAEPQEEPFTSEGAISEGVFKAAADGLHRQGVTGSGVRIAILDIGFQGYQELLGRELPSEVTVRNFNFGEGFEATSHGTAVAEIIHDFAPGAELLLVAVHTNLEYLAALNWLRNQDVSIISISIGFDNTGPLDGRSPVSEAASRLFDEENILVVTAAGNEQQNYWSGQFSDPDGNGNHNFHDNDETLEISLRAGDVVRVILNWDDWGADPVRPRSTQDYNLYLFCPSLSRVFQPGEICAASEDFQTGLLGQMPLERFFYVAPVTGTYPIRIMRASAGPGNHRLRLFVGGIQGGAFPMQYQIRAGTLTLPADGLGTFAVGAVDVFTDTIEPFSSLGPTWDERIKPDITAPNRIATATFGSFWGTSAATPHVAGSAALLKSQQPTRSAQDLRLLLQRASIDQAVQGKDNEYGAGIMSLENFAANAASSPLSGLWWSPLQNGHGFFFEVRNGALVATWYIYDQLGNPFWLLSSAPMMSSRNYFGLVHSFRGPGLKSPLNALFNNQGSTVLSNQIGSLAIEFRNPAKAIIQLQLNGDDLMLPNTIRLEAQPFLGYPAAEEIPQLPYASKYDGLWWNTEQNGHGFFINIQDSILTATWYTYDETGEPAWILTAGPMSSATSYSGIVYRFSGPALFPGSELSNLFDASGMTVTRIPNGTVSLTFTSDTAATLTLNQVFSVNETLALERFIF